MTNNKIQLRKGMTLLSLLLLIGSSCKEREDGVYQAEGYVLDYKTGEGAPNVLVAIAQVNSSGGIGGIYSGGGSTSLQTIATATTDQTGYYRTKYRSDAAVVIISANQLWRQQYNPAYWYEEREFKSEEIPDKGTYRVAPFNLRPLTQIKLRYRNTRPVDDSDRFALVSGWSSPSTPIPLLVSLYTNSPREFHVERGHYTAYGPVHQPRLVNNGIISYFSPRQVWIGRGVDAEQTFTVLKNEPCRFFWNVQKNNTTTSNSKELPGDPTTDFLIEY